MRQNKRFLRFVSKIMLVCFLFVSVQQAVFANMVSTTELVNNQAMQAEKQRLADLLSQDQVRSQLVAMGVDPADAMKRLDNMTDEEIQSFAAQMDQLPAGSGVLELAVFVFLVLLVTDLMGYTEIFPFVKHRGHPN